MQPNRRVLIVNCFETYEHRADLLNVYFRDRGCQVKIITSDWLHMHKTVRQTCPENYEMVHVNPYRKNLSPQRLMSHHGFAQAARKKMEEFQPDLLWVLIPPNSLAKTAAQYKKNHPKVKLVMDFIDMWPETMPISRFKNLPPFSNWKMLRDQSVGASDLVTTECRLYHEILENVCEKENLHTLYLAREVELLPAEAELEQDKISLCYLGSINNIIDIPCIGQIIGRFDQPVELHIIGDGEKRQELIDTASASGAEVIYHGKIYDAEEKRRILNRCHFGLNIMKSSVFVGLTMKSMDYFEYGLPIINNIRGDTWDFVAEYRLGMNLDRFTQADSEELFEMANRRLEVQDFFRRNFTYAAFCEQLDAMLQVLDQ